MEHVIPDATLNQFCHMRLLTIPDSTCWSKPSGETVCCERHDHCGFNESMDQWIVISVPRTLLTGLAVIARGSGMAGMAGTGLPVMTSGSRLLGKAGTGLPIRARGSGMAKKGRNSRRVHLHVWRCADAQECNANLRHQHLVLPTRGCDG